MIMAPDEVLAMPESTSYDRLVKEDTLKRWSEVVHDWDCLYAWKRGFLFVACEESKTCVKATNRT